MTNVLAYCGYLILASFTLYFALTDYISEKSARQFAILLYMIGMALLYLIMIVINYAKKKK